MALIAVLAAALIAGLHVTPTAYQRFVARVSPAPPAAGLAASGALESPTAAQPPTVAAAAGSVIVQAQGYWSWALLDRGSRQISGSANLTATNSTESMIKAWIVADFLRRTAEAGKTPTPQQLKQASTAIRDSNDGAAQVLYAAAGRDQVVRRLIQICGLTETKIVSGWWSRTQMSARDAVRMGLCIADTRAAGPQWTDWLLAQMRQVRGGLRDQPLGRRGTGGGRWGIIEGLPADVVPEVAIKNGWTPTGADGLWHINCLAVHEEWVLAVQARYPISLGLEHGAAICRGVTEQLVRNAQVVGLRTAGPSAAPPAMRPE